MPNRLNIPPELESLIEKRSGEDRRKAPESTAEASGASVASDADSPLHDAAEAVERRIGDDRRHQNAEDDHTQLG